MADDPLVGALWRAVEAGQDAEVARLLAASQCLWEAEDVRGRTALLRAALRGGAGAARLLLAHCPQRQVLHEDEDGRTALMLAAAAGHADVARLLLQHASQRQVAREDEQGRTPLLLAVAAGHEATAQVLLEPEHSPREQLAHEDEDGRTALMLAAMAGHEGLARLLLRCADPLDPLDQVQRMDDDARTPLLLAADGGHAGVVRLLLQPERGPAEQVGHTDDWGCSALMLAAAGGGVDVVALLLEHGAPALQVQQANEDGYNALMFAVERDDVQVATALLQHAPLRQLEHADELGRTALLLAASQDCLPMVQLLLDAHAHAHAHAPGAAAADAAEAALACHRVDCPAVLEALAARAPRGCPALSMALLRLGALPDPLTDAQVRCCTRLFARGADPSADPALPMVQLRVHSALRAGLGACAPEAEAVLDALALARRCPTRVSAAAWTPLVAAARAGDAEGLRRLLVRLPPAAAAAGLPDLALRHLAYVHRRQEGHAAPLGPERAQCCALLFRAGAEPCVVPDRALRARIYGALRDHMVAPPPLQDAVVQLATCLSG